MSEDGYSPLFQRTTKGSLCGKWPDMGLWNTIVSMKDRHGLLDVTPAYISFVSGLPVDEVIACMRRFCQPDPMSRSKAHDGARLLLLEPEKRDWGWRFVNHEYYRELARLKSKNAREIAEGKNKLRMDDRRGPPGTAADPLSNTNKNKNQNGGARAPAQPKGAARAPDREQARGALHHILAGPPGDGRT